CSRVFLFDVNEPDLLVSSAQSVDVSCYGFGDGSGTVVVEGGVAPYHYQWDSSPDDTLASVSGLAPGDYQVIVTDSNGCTVLSSISVSQPDSLIVTAGHDTIIFRGFPAMLYVESVSGGKGAVTYQWTPPDNVTNPASPGSPATPDETTIFTITVTDENGCIASDTQRVQVDVNLYTFPDAFVPNGNNSIFSPVTSATVRVMKLEIFNRWGQLLSENPSGWDGKYDGKLQPMDTYVYQAVMQLPDGTQKTERGDFILIW
ncbi:MAG TPA: T9SS type B sorting domain-containing protein, partial [Chitinophagales bacterium]|nr:T9SS type B sorting domain-containing protein [Chitinophagales bacterium]